MKKKRDYKSDFPRLISRLENMIILGAFLPKERLVEADLAQKMDDLLSNNSLRAELIAKGLNHVKKFHPRQTTENLIEVFKLSINSMIYLKYNFIICIFSLLNNNI